MDSIPTNKAIKHASDPLPLQEREREREREKEREREREMIFIYVHCVVQFMKYKYIKDNSCIVLLLSLMVDNNSNTNNK